jgi:hypothetical protein
MDSIKDDVRLKIDNKIVQKGVEITSKPIRGCTMLTGTILSLD